MGDALQAETLSITTGQPQTLYLDEKDREMMKGKRVIILDDVISTGSTLQGMRLLMQKAGAEDRRRGGDLHRGRARQVAGTLSRWGTCRSSPTDLRPRAGSSRRIHAIIL